MITLPTTKSTPIVGGPPTLCIYGRPKVGKGHIISHLPDCLVINTEPRGYDTHSVFKLEPKNFGELMEIVHTLNKRTHPYKFVVFDTVDVIEQWCEVAGTEFYKTTNAGANFTEANVTYIANGYGYRWVRLKFEEFLDNAVSVAKHVIFVAHIRDKFLGGKTPEAEDVQSGDLDLSAGVGRMLTSEVDATAHLTRRNRNASDRSKPSVEDLWASFKTSDTKNCGARAPHLIGKEFILCDNESRVPKWELIYPPEQPIVTTV